MIQAIMSALGKFQGHLLANVGRPIGLPTLSAFAVLIVEIAAALDKKD